MRTSEMIAYLEKHPEAKFSKDKINDFVYINNGYLYFERIDKVGKKVDEHLGGGNWNGNVSLWNDWTLVREPVPVWEAIKALTEGKTVEYENRNEKYTASQRNIGWSISTDALINGKWFIKEGE